VLPRVRAVARILAEAQACAHCATDVKSCSVPILAARRAVALPGSSSSAALPHVVVMSNTYVPSTKATSALAYSSNGRRLCSCSMAHSHARDSPSSVRGVAPIMSMMDFGPGLSARWPSSCSDAQYQCFVPSYVFSQSVRVSVSAPALPLGVCLMVAPSSSASARMCAS
jgi:hypothetical protein